MKVVRYADIEWTSHPDLRGGSVATQQSPKTLYKPLFKGTPGEPNHFEMVVSTYTAPKFYPRHRHDIDQLRWTLRGVSPWAPGMETPESSLIYIPAGTFYGPYERPAGIELMAIQFEGANQAPFVDFDSLLVAQAELTRRGSFERGQYTWTDANGVRRERDGHEAGWEQATGRTQKYPEARFSTPIEIHPANFAWRQLGGGAEMKDLGTFGELGTRLWMLALSGGQSFTFAPPGQTTLLFVTAGSGATSGGPIQQRDAIRLEAEEELQLQASERLELFALGLPRIG
jgi:hypothetical protein